MVGGMFDTCGRMLKNCGGQKPPYIPTGDRAAFIRSNEEHKETFADPPPQEEEKEEYKEAFAHSAPREEEKRKIFLSFDFDDTLNYHSDVCNALAKGYSGIKCNPAHYNGGEEETCFPPINLAIPLPYKSYKPSPGEFYAPFSDEFYEAFKNTLDEISTVLNVTVILIMVTNREEKSTRYIIDQHHILSKLFPKKHIFTRREKGQDLYTKEEDGKPVIAEKIILKEHEDFKKYFHEQLYKRGLLDPETIEETSPIPLIHVGDNEYSDGGFKEHLKDLDTPQGTQIFSPQFIHTTKPKADNTIKAFNSALNKYFHICEALKIVAEETLAPVSDAPYS